MHAVQNERIMHVVRSEPLDY